MTDAWIHRVRCKFGDHPESVIETSSAVYAGNLHYVFNRLVPGSVTVESMPAEPVICLPDLSDISPEGVA